MTMDVFLIFVLRILYVPFALSQSDPVPSHMCMVVGQSQQSITGYKFSINDFPEFCEATIYNSYYLDSDSTPIYPENEEAIKSLVAQKKTVYIYVAYVKQNEPWGDILDPKDQAAYDKIMCPLIQKVTELGVAGIILQPANIYSGVVTDYANKISTFVTKVKAELSTLKFGLYVNARTAFTNITDNSRFDFTVTNSVLDLYIINMFDNQVICDTDELLNGGNTVIESSDPNVFSLVNVVDAVSKSKLDKSKIFAMMRVLVYMPNGDDYFQLVPYNKYCQSTNLDDVCKSCADNTTTLNKEGASLKKTFKGLVSAWIDYDDFDNSCGCQNFPATKALFDGFDGTPVTPCAKLDVK